MDSCTIYYSIEIPIVNTRKPLLPGLGLENLSFFDLNNFTKVSLMIFMIFGKVEIIAVLYLIKKFLIKE